MARWKKILELGPGGLCAFFDQPYLVSETGAQGLCRAQEDHHP